MEHYLRYVEGKRKGISGIQNCSIDQKNNNALIAFSVRPSHVKETSS